MTVYEYLRAKKGHAYKPDQIIKKSWLYISPEIDTTPGRIAGRSRIHGDIEPLMQDRVIDLIIEIGARYKMSYRDIAHILLFTKVESGFNPDAAAGTTSAGGLGQYTAATVKEAAKPSISKSHLGFVLNLSGDYVLDAERGAFSVLLSYMICKEAASHFFPQAAEENTYLFHHEGWYFQPANASNPERVADVHAIIAKKIIPHLAPLEKLLQAKTQVQFSLKTADHKPYDNQPYVVVIPNEMGSKQAAPVSVQGSAKAKVIVGKTDSSGNTPLIEVPGLSEVVFAPLNRHFKKILLKFPINSSLSSSAYTVKSGDTLSSIAKANSTSVEELVAENHISNRNNITPGMELQLNKGEYWWRRPSIEWLASLIAPHIEANNAQAAEAVIEHKRSHVSLPQGNKAHGSDVMHNRISIVGGRTKATVDAQKTVKKVPHQTNIAATVKPVKLPSTDKATKKVIPGLLYPLPIKATEDYHTGARRFGSSRSGGKRRHAGIDLYAPKGTPVRAVADGVVIRVYNFYCSTSAIEVNHGTFIARYGEVDPNPLNLFVKNGQQIKRGDSLGKVGHLVGIKVPSDMLHLEFYGTTESPKKTDLTQRGNRPYQRRADLFDPAPSIDIAEMK